MQERKRLIHVLFVKISLYYLYSLFGEFGQVSNNNLVNTFTASHWNIMSFFYMIFVMRNIKNFHNFWYTDEDLHIWSTLPQMWMCLNVMSSFLLKRWFFGRVLKPPWKKNYNLYIISKRYKYSTIKFTCDTVYYPTRWILFRV